MCPFGSRACYCDNCSAPKRFSKVLAKVGRHPGLGARMETATAMEETVIKQIPCHKFFERLGVVLLFLQKNTISHSVLSSRIWLD